MQATVHNSTHATCLPPSDMAAATNNATIALSNNCGAVSRDNVTKDDQCRNEDAIWSSPAYYALYPTVSIAVGRRPYIQEDQGHLFVTTAFSPELLHLIATSSSPPPGGNFRCRVEVHVGQSRIDDGTWEAGRQENAQFTFNLDILPPRVDDQLGVILRCSYNVTIKKMRRFQRVKPEGELPPTSYSQVDHSNTGVRLGGKPFVGVGFYMSGSPQSSSGYSVKETKNKFFEQSKRGMNMMMLYGGSSLSREEQIEILDAAGSVGMKIAWEIVGENDWL